MLVINSTMGFTRCAGGDGGPFVGLFINGAMASEDISRVLFC